MEKDKNKVDNNNSADKDNKERYYFGTGIDLIDFNVLSAAEVEMAVNGIIPEPDDKNDSRNKV
jgi:hypothetical protein